MSREKRSAVAVVGVPSFFSFFFFCYYELGHSWDSFNFLTCLPLFPNYFVLPFFFSANIDVNLTFLLFPFVTLFIYLFFYQSRFIASFFSFIFSLIVGFFFTISFRHSLGMLGPQSSFPPPSRPTTQLSPPSATSSPVTVPPFFPLPRCESIYQLKSVSVAALNGPPTDDE